ncbi:hypothetical protein BD626DRAFT_413222 [Schizophyllum amplum]|uniref:Uncharacterized protein n=1 Tax=Schizophyllum amplum TaxID=97359 RepID=A0A550BVX3_9AGAR|nr:hypothetical protein BD626DRAFT_413222 [Auriculariopsis ampla]
MVSFLPFLGTSAFPRFVARLLGGLQWISVGDSGDALYQVDPLDRFIAPKERQTSVLVTWFNPRRPWEGYLPTSYFGEDDILHPCFLPSTAHLLVPLWGTIGIRQEWRSEFEELCMRIEHACEGVYARASHLLRRPEVCEEIDYRPFTVNHQELASCFGSSEEAWESLNRARAEALTNVGFLSWFTRCVGSWDIDLNDEDVAFIRSLRLEDRQARGVIVNVAPDCLWLDFRLLVEHRVPFHYLWTPNLHMDDRFLSLNPWLIARTIDLERQLGREPSDQEVLAGQGRAAQVLWFDRWFQFRGQRPTTWSRPLRRTEFYTVEDFVGWYPRDLDDQQIIGPALERYEVGYPDPLLSPRRGMESRIYRWARRGSRDSLVGADLTPPEPEYDYLNDWEIFDLPETFKRGQYLHGRELRRFSCASLPEEMENVLDLPEDTCFILEFEFNHLWSNVTHQVDVNRTAFWNQLVKEMPKLRYDSERGSATITDVPSLEDLLDDEYEAPEPREAGSEGRYSAAESAARVSDQEGHAPLGERIARAAAGSASTLPRERPASSFTASRTPSRLAGSSRDRRSASPPVSRGSSSLSSRADLPRIPDPSGRWAQLSRRSEGWPAALERFDREMELLDNRLSSGSNPRAQDVEGRVFFADEVLRNGYVVLGRAQDQVRMWVWATRGRYTRPEDLLERLVVIGAPFEVALPQSSYPSANISQALPDEEAHTAAFVAYLNGGADLFRRWRSGLLSLARKPYAAAFYFAGGIPSYVLRRWAWHIIKDVVGLGPCKDTRERLSGSKHFPGGNTPSLFSDACSTEELHYLHGCVTAVRDGDPVRWIFPPPHVWERSWPSNGEWGPEEEKFMATTANELERGVAEVPTEHLWRDRLRARGRNRLGPQFRARDALQDEDASAWADYLARIYGKNKKYRKIADLAPAPELSRLYE